MSKGKFKVGDTVTCLDSASYETELTFGKDYKVVQVWQSGQIFVMTDTGKKMSFYPRHFYLMGEKNQPVVAAPKHQESIVNFVEAMLFKDLDAGKPEFAKLKENLNAFLKNASWEHRLSDVNSPTKKVVRSLSITIEEAELDSNLSDELRSWVDNKSVTSEALKSLLLEASEHLRRYGK